MMNHTLFVYGTLKRGRGNHRLLAGQIFRGNALTKHCYALYQCGIPFLTTQESICQIAGEVYDVDDHTLARVDRLEGHPYAYRRVTLPVILARGDEITAWAYVHDHPRGTLNSTGIFEE